MPKRKCCTDLLVWPLVRSLQQKQADLNTDQGMNRWEGAALVAVSRWERVSIWKPHLRWDITDNHSGITVLHPYERRSKFGADRSIATFLSFWNHEGAHETKSQPWVDWNEEIIRAMVDDVQPSAEPFRAENERSFETLSESTHQGLSLLSTRLGGTSVKERAEYWGCSY